MTATHYEAQDIVLEIVAHFLTFECALVCTHAGAREASTAFKLDPWSAARNAAAVVEQEPRGGRAPSECVVVVHGRVRVKKEIYGYRCVVLSWARLTALLFHLPVLLFRRSALPAALLACVYTHLSACLIARLFTSLHARLSECLALPCLACSFASLSFCRKKRASDSQIIDMPDVFMPPLEYETFGMWISIPLVIRDGNDTSKRVDGKQSLVC
jgi:hypothetical protein